jgi:hypothetical protein
MDIEAALPRDLVSTTLLLPVPFVQALSHQPTGQFIQQEGEMLLCRIWIDHPKPNQRLIPPRNTPLRIVPRRIGRDLRA